MKRLGLFAILICLVFSSAGGSAVILEMPLEELVIESDHILTTTLQSRKNIGNPDEYGVTEVESILSVIRSHKGGIKPGETVVVFTTHGWEDAVEFPQAGEFVVFVSEGETPEQLSQAIEKTAGAPKRDPGNSL